MRSRCSDPTRRLNVASIFEHSKVGDGRSDKANNRASIGRKHMYAAQHLDADDPAKFPERGLPQNSCARLAVLLDTVNTSIEETTALSSSCL